MAYTWHRMEHVRTNTDTGQRVQWKKPCLGVSFCSPTLWGVTAQESLSLICKMDEAQVQVN